MKSQNIMIAFEQIPDWPVALISWFFFLHLFNKIYSKFLAPNLFKQINFKYIHTHTRKVIETFGKTKTDPNSPSVIQILLKICIQICIDRNPFFSRFVFTNVWPLRCVLSHLSIQCRLLATFSISNNDLLICQTGVKERERKKTLNSTCRQ